MVLSTIISVIGLFTGWVKWRDAQLRRDDVLTWANQGIAELETLLMICLSGQTTYEPLELEKKLKEIALNAAILIEQGRLFFKNQQVNRYGKHKEAAYRGLRPCILDPLLVAHQIARHWSESDEQARARMRFVAEKYLKTFVSLVQKEVGRSRTASGETKRGGDGIDLVRLMARVDESQVNEFLDKARETNSRTPHP